MSYTVYHIVYIMCCTFRFEASFRGTHGRGPLDLGTRGAVGSLREAGSPLWSFRWGAEGVTTGYVDICIHLCGGIAGSE